ncbi:MAG TPA: gliding motility-associated C-terminal domain-containing protein [Chitinophagales bacterium]|nr:gliding motility-associated C-terminal domain-containing protein [Chitinophagales bacterium]
MLDLPSAINFVKIGDLDVSGTQITVEALVKWNGNAGGNDVVSKHTSPFNVNYLLRPSTFELTTYISGNSGPTQFIQMVNPFALVINQWYHIAGTYDGSFVRYYVDGCLVIELPFSGNMCQNNLQASIGAQSQNQSEQFFGKLDEVRIWNVCRTQAELKANMLDLPSPGSQAGLLAYYKFANDYINSQGNATYNGIAVGSPLFTIETVVNDPIAIDSITIVDATCNAISDGSITVFASNANLQYSIDGINFQANSLFSNVGAGFYTVYVKSTEGCIVDSTIEVGIVNPPSLQANAATICEGAIYLLPDGTPATVQGIYEDTLLAANGCDSLVISTTLTVIPSIIQNIPAAICPGEDYLLPGGITTNVPGVYLDTLAAASGCDSILITTLVILPVTTQTVAVSICNGDSYLLPSGNIVDTAGIYNDTLISSVGCDSIVITDLSVIPVMVLNVAAAICEGESYQLPAGGITNTAGIYTDTLFSFASCDTIVITDLTVHPALVQSISIKGITCNGAGDASAQLIALSGLAPYSFDWGTASFDDTSFVTHLNPGNYTVYCTDANGCRDTVVFEITDPDTMMVSTTSTPLSQWQANDATASAVVSGGDPPYTYVWSSQPTQFTETATGLPAGTYFITVRDSNGCILLDSVVIEESPNILAIPNVFTPNGDGLNDLFQPNLLNVNALEMRIFNRWGKMVYQSNDPDSGWDGKANSADAELGIYVYYMQASFLDGSVVDQSGSVILLR